MASRAVSTGDKPAQGTTQHNNNSWSSINGYPQTTMASYSHSDNTYMPPIASDLDPSQQTQQHKLQQQHPPLTMRHATHHHHQLPQLHMHSVPTHPTWPSMLTNPGGLAASPPTIHYPPHNGPNRLPLPPLKAKLRNKSGRTGPRKTLTDDDRRRMCEYATANPGVKQSDIGSIFGVERSTVSKVLRNREKYFVKARPSVSKKNKNKFPELERALSNWVRNAQRSGTFVTDAAIRDRFLFFVHSTGNSETYQACANGTWLEKFKQKNGIQAHQPVRRVSETGSSDGYSGITPPVSAMDSPSLVPMEPTGLESLLSPRTSLFEMSPLSRNRDGEEQDAEGMNRPGTNRFMTFGAGHNNENGTEGISQSEQFHRSESFGSSMAMDACVNDPATYKPSSSQGSTSVSSVFTTTPVSSYSSSSVSPTTPYPFSPDSNVSPFLACDPMAPPGSTNFQRPRSQTLPALNLENVSHVNEQQPARHDRCDSCYGGDSPVWSSRLRRCASSNARCQSGSWSGGGSSGSTSLNSGSGSGNCSGNGSGNGSGSGSGSGANGAMLSPCPPSQEDALQAADTLFRFIRSLPGVFNQADRADLSHIVDKVHLQSNMDGLDTYGCEDGQRHT